MFYPLEKTINNFRRDLHPWDEVIYWERLAAAYLDLTADKNFSLEKPKDILSALFGFSTGMMDEDKANAFQQLTYDEVTNVGDAYRGVVPEIIDPEGEGSE